MGRLELDFRGIDCEFGSSVTTWQCHNFFNNLV